MVFPVTRRWRMDGKAEALAGLRLESLLKSDLLNGGSSSDDGGGKAEQAKLAFLRKNREALLAAISGWGLATVLELRITVRPDLRFKARGRIDIHLLLRCQAATEEAATELLVARYLALSPLLDAFMPEACWRAVIAEDELGRCLNPFAATHAVSLHRKRERLSISAEVSRPAIGFAADGQFFATQGAGVDHRYPWEPSHDDWSRLLETISGQLDPVQLLVRLRPGAETGAEIDALLAAIHTCEEFLDGRRRQLGHAPLLEVLREIYVRRLAEMKGPCFHLGVYLTAGHPIDVSLPNVLGRALCGQPDDALFRGAFEWRAVAPPEVAATSFFADRDPFSLGEAGCAFRLPSPPTRMLPGLPIQRFRTMLAALPGNFSGKEGVELFDNVHQGHEQPVCIDADSRMRHCFVVGQTGTGKSSFMESLVTQDIRAGRGVAVIDPHGDMIENILLKIPAERVDDVMVFDLVDRDFPVGFNVLEWKTLDERDLIIDELYRTMDRIYDLRQTGGPIFETHFRNMMKLLMGDKPRGNFTPTVLEFVRCYLDLEFRHWLCRTVDDAQLRDFIEEAESTSGDIHLRNVAPYITSKFGRFVNDITLKRIVGQSRSRIDFEAMMDGGKILLVKLGKGRFGSEVSALLANMIVLRFKLAAMKRGERPASERRDFFLYVDEAHNLPQENFTELLSEARKYRLGLTLATQYCSQLGDPGGAMGGDLLASVFGNVGTTVIFRVGIQDAGVLANGLTPFFEAADIINLPNYRGYARMNLAQGAMLPFSFKTKLDRTPENSERAQAIKESSRRRYGRPSAVVDEEIATRATAWMAEEEAGFG